MSKRKRNPSRRTFHLERLELRALLASDVVWNNPNWDAAPEAPEAGRIVRGADAFYDGGVSNVGLTLDTRRLAITTATPEIKLPEGLTRVWGMGTAGNVYEWTTDVTPGFVAEVNAIVGVVDVVPVYRDLISKTDMTVLNEVIVGMRPGEKPSEFFARYPEFESFQRVAGTTTQYVGQMTRHAGRAAIDLANRLSIDPAVEWAHPNFYVNFERHFIPNDPRFNNQWHLRNTGASGGVPDADADVDLAWDVNQGGSNNIIMSIIDDGVQSTHPDLNVWTNPGEIDGDSIDNDNNGWVDDIHGWNFVTLTNASEPIGSDAHGTAVAGVAAASGNNNRGVAGAAYNSPVISIKIFHDGFVAALDDVASALLYAGGITADGTGTWRAGDLVNNSWGGGGPFPSMNAALAIATVQGRGGLGTTYFFSSGNSGAGVLGEPAGQTAVTPGVIAVGASTNSDFRSNYSQFGAALDIVSPSNGGTLAIDTTDRTGADGYAGGDYTGTGATGFGGTSSASPLAAGIGALALAQADVMGVALRPAELRAMIRNSTDLIGGVTYNINTGKHIEYGFGRINANTLVRGVGNAEISVVNTTNELLSSSIVDLGSALAGQFVETTLRIRNQGSLPLDLTAIDVPAPFQVRNFTPKALDIGEATTFTIRFAPTAPGSFAEDLVISNNDLDEGSFVLRVLGTAVAPQIGGTVYEDYDGDGSYETFERGSALPGTSAGLNPGFAIAYLETAGADNMQFDGTEPIAIVSPEGFFTFASVPTGDYILRISATPEWKETSVTSYPITVTNSSFSVGNDFGFSKRNRAYDRVIEDLDSNGILDGIDVPLSNWLVSLGTNTATNSTSVAVPIFDNSTSFSPINVVDTGIIQDVNVNINIAHTWDSDLIITLVAPDGTEVTLASGVGFDGDDFTNTTFDDSATIPIAGGTAPFTGTFRPTSPLSAMNGKSLAGIWQLKVADTFTLDEGTILSWSLIVVRDLGAVSDSNGYALLDLPTGVGQVTSQLVLQTPYIYTVPINGSLQAVPIDEPIYDRIYGAKLPELPPTDILLAGSTVPENAAPVFVGTLTSRDPNRGSTFTYSLETGAGSTDNALFTILGDQLLLTTAVNYEVDQTLSVRIRTTDNAGLFYEEAFVITVTNVNEDPLALVLTPTTAREDALPGVVVGTFLTADTDFLTDFVFNYSFATGAGDTDNASFLIVGDRLLVNAALDFETRPLMYVRVRTTDLGGLFYEETFTITVTDVNEPPTVINLSGNTLPENELAGYVIGQLTSNDPDLADTLKYTLVPGIGDTDNIMFGINNGDLWSRVTFNFESRTQYYIRVRVTDFQGLFTEQTFTVNITDVNEAPDRIRISANRLSENLPSGQFIGTISATDPDTGDAATVALVLGGLDNNKFTLSGNSLLSNDPFDFEQQRIYQILVEATDGNGQTYQAPLDIEILNQNEAPSGAVLTPDTVAESSPVGTVVGAFTSIDPDRDNVFKYEFVSGTGSDDNQLFTIAGDKLKTAQVFDFFVKNNYSIRIKTTDLGGLSTEQVVAVNVSNVNDAPTDITLSKATIAENLPLGSSVGTLTSVDADDVDTYSYALVTGSGDNDNALFSIVGDQLVSNAVFNFEAKNQFNIRMQSRDAGGLLVEKTFSISVTNVNEPPLSLRLSKRSIPENSAVGTVLGMLTTLDTDTLTDTAFTYAFLPGIGSDDNGLFAINGNLISLVGSLDFETKTSATIRVQTTDAGGLSLDTTFLIDITNVNEAPTQTLLSSSTLNENLPADSLVGSFTNNDPDSPDAHRYTLVSGTGSADNAFFVIVGNELKTRQAFNFEAPRSPNYAIRVRTTDRAGTVLDSTYTVSIQDQNDPPSNVQLSTSQVPENLPINTVVGTIVGTDEDAGATLTYELVSGTGSDDNGQFVLAGDQIQTSSVFDFETKSSYSIRIRVTDQFGQSFEKPLTISVSNVNESPTDLRLSPNSVFEAQPVGTVVGALLPTDVDANDTFTYSLIAGSGDANNGLFEIVGGRIRTKQVFDFDLGSSYSVRVKVTDAGGLSFEKPLTVSIVNINDPPTAVALSNSTLNENASNGFAVGLLSTTDADDTDTFTYALVPGLGDGDNSRWSIVGNQLVTNSTIDFEQKQTHFVRVRSTDAGGLFTENTFTIRVRDVNEAPLAINVSGGILDENSPLQSVIATLSSLDLDAGDIAFTYTLVGGTGATDNASFQIAGNRILTNAPLNFETQSVYSVRVRSTDAGGMFLERQVVLLLRDVNEAPTFTDFVFLATENAPTSTSIARATGADQDAGDTLTYSLVAGAGSAQNVLVTIDPTTGFIFPKDPLNFEQTPLLNIRLRVTDRSGLFSENAYLILVTDANDAPTDVRVSPAAIAENSLVGSLVGTFASTDEDARETFTYALVSGTGSTDNGDFSIVGNQLLTTRIFDFETKSSYSIRVRTTDGSGASVERALVISVNDVNEAPSSVALSNATIPENGAPNTVVGSLSSTDQDGGDAFTYSLIPQSGSNDHTAFTIVGSQLRARSGLDFESQSQYSVTIRTTDSGGLSFDRNFDIQVLNVQEPPAEIALSGGSILEGSSAGSVVGTLSGFDPDAVGGLTYSLPIGRFNNDDFLISGDQLLSGRTFDFESQSVYFVVVRATDTNGDSTDSVFPISILDANEPATRLALSNTQVAENASNFLIGSLSSDDQYANDPYTYELVSGAGSSDNAAFEIVNGQLFAKTPFDFETKNSYQVRIQGVDGALNQIQASFVITVLDRNDAPTGVSLAPATIAENSGSNRVVGVLGALDQDAGDAFEYFFTPVNGVSTSSNFLISGNQLIARSSFNFESQPSYTESISVRDRSGEVSSTLLTVRILDVNEAPTAISISNQAVDENLAPGSLVGLLNGADVDAGDALTFSLVSGNGSFDNSKFRIVGNRLETNTRFNYEVQDAYSVRVRATDRSGLLFERQVIVTINNLDEPPPTATNDSYRTSYGRPIVMDVLSNDFGKNAAIDRSTVRILTAPLSGTATVLSDGRIQFTHSISSPTQIVLQYEFQDENAVASNVGTTTISFYSAFQNQANPLDVDYDGVITPLDVLAIVNDINAAGSRQLPLNSPDTNPAVDINGDGFVNPLDVLLLVNRLNSPGSPLGEGEGAPETAPASDSPSSTAVDLFFAQAFTDETRDPFSGTTMNRRRR
ncbi:MAG: cadherin domain-containing protein [Pirellula sp.]